MTKFKIEDSQFIKTYCADDSYESIPENWATATFEQVFDDATDSKAKLQSSEMKTDGQYPVIDQGQKFISGYTDRGELVRQLSSEVIIFGDHTRSFKFVDFPFVQGADGTRVLLPREKENTKFLFHFLKSVNLPDKGYSRHFKYLKQLRIPIPPLGEQRRIVEKIESTQEKINSIESTVANSEILIEKCRESMLQKAFRGQLVPQDEGDEPASGLIERIRSERVKQPESEKKKKDELPSISPDEIPFEIPSSWAWVRLGEISEKIGSGQTPKGGNSVYKKTGIPLIRSQNVLNGHLDLTDVAYIDKATDQDMRGSRVYAGDVLYNITGGSIGRSCVTPADFNGGNVNQHVLSIRPMIKGLYMSTYISEYLLSPYGKDFIFKNKKGAARDAITKKQIENLVIPLPPLKEIDRIIRKIQKSYNQIHTFKQRAKTLKVAGNSLANSILSSAFLGKLVPQISSEGTGHILLEKISSRVENQNNNKLAASKNKTAKGISKIKGSSQK